MATRPDWEAIERAYRAGLLSIRNIADKFGVSDTAIRKRANKHGWQRDLTDKVRESTREKLVRTQVRTDSSRTEAQTEEQIIEEASSEAAAVVLRHREGLAEWRAISNKLCAALSVMPVNEENHDKFARSLNAGVDAQLKVIKGERQAYNLDTEEGDKDTNALSDLMDALSNEA